METYIIDAWRYGNVALYTGKELYKLFLLGEIIENQHFRDEVFGS